MRSSFFLVLAPLVVSVTMGGLARGSPSSSARPSRAASLAAAGPLWRVGFRAPLVGHFVRKKWSIDRFSRDLGRTARRYRRARRNLRRARREVGVDEARLARLGQALELLDTRRAHVARARWALRKAKMLRRAGWGAGGLLWAAVGLALTAPSGASWDDALGAATMATIVPGAASLLADGQVRDAVAEMGYHPGKVPQWLSEWSRPEKPHRR